MCLLFRIKCNNMSRFAKIKDSLLSFHASHLPVYTTMGILEQNHVSFKKTRKIFYWGGLVGHFSQIRALIWHRCLTAKALKSFF